MKSFFQGMMACAILFVGIAVHSTVIQLAHQYNWILFFEIIPMVLVFYPAVHYWNDFLKKHHKSNNHA